jgi:hypothetical protein
MSYREIEIPKRVQRAISEPAPVLQWLKVADLVVDERYQRPLQSSNWASIHKIAADFMWSRFSAVLVAPIEGGRYAIIDGQHRTHAAAMIGIEAVPAMIVMIHAHEQAKAFVDVNTRRVAIHPATIFKAALAAREEWAVNAVEAVQAAGCRLLTSPTALRDRKPGDIMSIALIRGAVASGKSWAVTESLKALMEFEPNSVANFSDLILAPLVQAVSSFPPMTHDVLVRAFKTRRPAIVVEAAYRLADLEKKPRVPEAKAMFAALIRKTLLEGAS